jgi:hypothetical protein
MPAGGFSPKWTDTEDDYLKANYSLIPAQRIADHLGRSRVGVVLRGGKYGLVSYQQIGTASIRHDYFAHIDTPEKAYVLGLLAADGSIAQGRSGARQIVLALQRKDRSGVEFVRDQIAPAARLYESRMGDSDMVRFAIQSKQLAADLASHGVTAAKSLTLAWPTGLPERLANSYICGYFDGDGSLGRGKDLRWAVTSGSYPFLQEIQARVAAGAAANVGGPYRDGRKICWSIVSGGRLQVPRIDAWIHADVHGLARKRLDYDQVPVEPVRSDF